MNRRDALAGFLGVVAGSGSIAVFAQLPAGRKPFRIGFVVNFAASALDRKQFVEDMRTAGWRERQDFEIIESGLAVGESIEEAARRTVLSKPDVIVVITTAYALAVQRLTATIPIVMWASGYPVEAGVADSLARPGRNVTGNTIYAGTGIWAKLLELLRDAKPGIKRISVLWGYVPPAFPSSEIEPCYREIRQGAAALGVAAQIVDVPAVNQLPVALREVESAKPDALVITSGPALWVTRQQLVEYARDRKLPTVSDFDTSPSDNRLRPLLVYAPTWPDISRRMVYYVDRILRGANPADLPIQRPARFELIVNRQMAKSIGLTLPQLILLRADRVIE